MTAYIGYQNHMVNSGATVTADWTEPTGFDVENCFDWKTHTSTKLLDSSDHKIKIDAGSGNTYTADYFAMVGHNLSDAGATISLQYSSDDVSYTTLLTDTPSDNLALFKYDSTGATARYWQFLISGGDASTVISQIQFGQAFQLRPISTGFKPPAYEKYTPVNARGINANFLGRSVMREAQKLTIKQTAITEAQLRSDYVPWLEHAARYPFFFCWDYERYSGESVYCWTDKNAGDPVYSNLCHLSLSLNVEAVKQ